MPAVLSFPSLQDGVDDTPPAGWQGMEAARVTLSLGEDAWRSCWVQQACGNILIYTLPHTLACPNTSCLRSGPAGLWVGNTRGSVREGDVGFGSAEKCWVLLPGRSRAGAGSVCEQWRLPLCSHRTWLHLFPSICRCDFLRLCSSPARERAEGWDPSSSPTQRPEVSHHKR